MALLRIILKDVGFLQSTFVKSNDHLKTLANSFYNMTTFNVFFLPLLWDHLSQR